MNHQAPGKRRARPAASTALRYGLALASVAAALGLAQAFLYFRLPQPFTAFALSAIAISFWSAGTKPGLLAAVLASLVRTFFFEPDADIVSRIVYDLVFVIFAGLMIQATRARDELEVRVAERTAALTEANEGLRLENAERRHAEAMLRRTEAYLTEAQRLTHTGSFASNIAARAIVHWSPETFRLFGFDPEHGVPSFEAVLERIHPDDREWMIDSFRKSFGSGIDREDEFRIVLPDGVVRHIRFLTHPAYTASGDLDGYVGTVIDVTERRRADEERDRLRQAQADLAHVNRVSTMGELTASLAHEVNQPIAAALTNANTCLLWLAGDAPNIEEARAAAMRIVQDGTRAADIIGRIRLLFKKGTPQRELVDVNDVVREMTILLRSEATRYAISVRTELAADCPPIVADRVQLQQVLMNLIMNSIDAMKDVTGAREINITSTRGGPGRVLLSVSDTGVGLPQEGTDHLFKAFFTTKPHGTGMGLSISRSIVESHGGRLWAADHPSRGAIFHVALPTNADTQE
jgi:PAS domain S-box-containing protein